MDASSRPAIVMDCGSGFSKVGFGGNAEPNFCIPTVLGSQPVAREALSAQEGLDDFGECIGYDALACGTANKLKYPIKQGLVECWDSMERFWFQSIYKYMRVDPEDHYFVVAKPPFTPLEHGEYTAEIMFETFNVPGLYVGIQSVMALYANQVIQNEFSGSLTGTVVDSGDGITQITPVVDGQIIGSSIKSLPVAGRDITCFIQQFLRDRGEPIPPSVSMEAAKKIKETFCYVCTDMVKEFEKFDQFPEKRIGRQPVFSSSGGEVVYSTIGPEVFLGPEIIFNPEIFGSEFSEPLPALIDGVVQGCPIDTKRQLYKNVVLCGGSANFTNFSRRLGKDIRKIANARLIHEAQPIEVNVVNNCVPQHAVWLGGSLICSTQGFKTIVKTRVDYQEYGPRYG